jgi:hypothetical protein
MKGQKILGIPARLVIYLLPVLLIFVVIPLLLLLINPQALLQDKKQVVIREPGKRLLGAPTDADTEAQVDVDFALLSQAVYQKPIDAQKIKEGEAVDPDSTLRDRGWCKWEGFPKGTEKETFDAVHLRVQVWSNLKAKKVAVAFGGTVARNRKDWISDMRWFIPHHDDQYTKIVDTLGTAFIAEYSTGHASCEVSPNSDLFSTGHSLGGGLAQEFAYSLPINDTVMPVKKVYAFDPSPVTGYYSVKEPIRDHNRTSLAIDRIYERGEVLAIFRSLINIVYPPSECNPTIRQVRYNLFHTWNPFAGHSMAELAFRLLKTAKGQSIP